MNDDEQIYFNKLNRFFLAKGKEGIHPDTPIEKIFPVKSRFKLFNELEQEYNWYLPDFQLSKINVIVRLILVLFIMISVAVTIKNYMFYIAIDNLGSFFGVLLISIILPYSVMHFFLPSYIHKSGFGNIKTVGDLIKEIVLLNYQRSR